MTLSQLWVLKWKILSAYERTVNWDLKRLCSSLMLQIHFFFLGNKHYDFGSDRHQLGLIGMGKSYDVETLMSSLFEYNENIFILISIFRSIFTLLSIYFLVSIGNVL